MQPRCLQMARKAYMPRSVLTIHTPFSFIHLVLTLPTGYSSGKPALNLVEGPKSTLGLKKSTMVSIPATRQKNRKPTHPTTSRKPRLAGLSRTSFVTFLSVDSIAYHFERNSLVEVSGFTFTFLIQSPPEWT